MKQIDIRVLWLSEREFVERYIEFNNRTFHLIATDSSPNLRVFDASLYADFISAKADMRAATVPTLVICPDDDTETWMLDLQILDEICPESRYASDLPLIAVRQAVRAHEWAKYFGRSFKDSLTGLLSRQELLRRLDLELTDASAAQPVSLLMTDIDHFKRVNDVYGHGVGDRVLSAVAKILLTSIQDEHSAFRFGGEEFALVVQMTRTQAVALGEFIRQEVQDFDYSDIAADLTLTVSIGVATNLGDLDPELFIRDVDEALYKAKAGGRNLVVSAGAQEDDSDPTEAAIINFENRIRVLTERLTSALSSKSRELVMQLKREADYDGLTGLHNRRYFDRRMAREFDNARESGSPLSLIFIDIDHFGKVNKTYGFPTGDRTLQNVAWLIRENIRAVDWVGRYGGEELCVILPGTAEEEAVDVAGRIWKAVGSTENEAYDGRHFIVTLSLGVAQLRDSDSRLVDFIQRTSDRTRYAKEHGRNQIRSKDRK